MKLIQRLTNLIGKTKKIIELNERYDDRLQGLRDHYICDYCSGNCGQCGVSPGGFKNAKAKLKEWYREERQKIRQEFQ